MKQIQVRSAGISDTGLLRSENQDQFLVTELTRSMMVKSSSISVSPSSRLFGGPLGYLFFVADGMGGHRGGSEASLLAVEYFVNAVLNSTRWPVQVEALSQGPFVEDLKTILLNAHRMIQSRSELYSELKGMGTTMTLAYVAWPNLFIVHAGDTRCYLMRGDEMRLLTSDHTVANQMMRSGKLNPSAVERSPWSNVLVNALGADAEEVFAEVHQLDLVSGDFILMCSDGLNKHVTDQQIREVILRADDPQAACQTLIDLAKLGGGTDNITVIVGQFLDDPSSSTARMKILASEPNEERTLQDVEVPASEYDTNSDMVTDEFSEISTDEDKDTGEYPHAKKSGLPNPSERQHLDRDTTAEYRPKN